MLALFILFGSTLLWSMFALRFRFVHGSWADRALVLCRQVRAGLAHGLRGHSAGLVELCRHHARALD